MFKGIVIGSALLISLQATDVLASNLASAKRCNDRLKDAELDKSLGIRAEPVSKVPAPFSYDTPYGKISSGQLFRDLGGYYCDSVHGHAMIYFHIKGFTVVSSGYERSYPSTDLRGAIRDYERIINSYKLESINAK